MSKKSSLKMSFEVDTSEQQVAPEEQTIVAPVQQKETTRRVRQTVVEEKQYSSGKFGHIKDNLEDQQRYNRAFASMPLRAGRAGDQFHVEMKLEKRYDDDEKRGIQRRVMEWIKNVVEVPIPEGTDWKELQLFLRDGTVLCKLMNKLLKHANMKNFRFRSKAGSAFVGMNNLEAFLGGVQEYQVPNDSLFQPADLHEGRKAQMPNIFQCLNSLGCIANARQFRPAYEETAPPKAEWCRDECYE